MRRGGESTHWYYLPAHSHHNSRDFVQLTDDMRAELERRLALNALEQPDDPAFRDLPRIDLASLLALVAVAVAVVLLLQAG